jgi:protein-tyrosine phosphatase
MNEAVKPLFIKNFSANAPLRILMVCMGNICRSPSAEAVLRHKLQAAGLAGRVEVASAGTHNYHPGKPADPRSAHHAALRGYDLSPHRARQIRPADFEHHQLVLTMDWDNQALTEEACPPAHLPNGGARPVLRRRQGV